MTDTSPKPERRRWLVIALMIAAVLLIGFNYALQKRRLRTWALSVQERGITPYVMAALSDVDPASSITNRVRVILSGYKCYIVIENQEQAESLLDVADCPLPLEFMIRPSVPAHATQRLREKFPTADIEENSWTGMTNSKWRAPLEQQQAK